MDLPFILTTAGLNALVNPANTGTSAIVVDRIGLSATVLPGDPEDNVGLLALPAEIKRLATFAGDVVGDDTIHVTIRDETPDVYQLHTFGLYSAAGVLLAFYTQPAVIMEKAAASMLLLAADLKFTTPVAAELVFGDTTFINPPATSEMMGVVELATAAETATGTDATRAVTPFGLKWVLDQLLPGKSNVGHTHAASDVVSGTFAVARIPDLAQAKITGLVDALAGKAAAVHTHVMGDITGLVAALGAKLAIADFTWANLVGKPNVAIIGQDAGFGALTSQGSSVWTAATFDPALKVSTANFTWANLLGKPNVAINGQSAAFGDLTSQGSPVWTAANFDPADKAAADHTHSWGQVTGKPSVAVVDTDTVFRSVQIRSATPSQARVYFGDQVIGGRRLDFMDDVFSFVGAPVLEMGYRVWTSNTFNPASKSNVGHTHTAAEITDLLDKFWPAGELKLYDTAAAPAGVRVLVANGATVSRSTYARLFTAIGTRYGVGDGATTFQLPDWRGVFFRGLDSGRGLDTGRALGVLQMSQNLAHSHTLPVRGNPNAGGNVEDADGTGPEPFVTTGSEGGSEARPVNQALLACITY